MYYKLLSEGQIVDAVETLEFVRYQKRNGIFLICGEKQAQAVIGFDGEKIWLLEEPEEGLLAGYPVVTYEEIGEIEYLAIREVLDKQGSVEDVPPQEPSKEDGTIEFLREKKIEEMSGFCRASVIAGFDIELSDGQTYHFSLEIEDQIKISKLADKAKAGEKLLPWHPDDGWCRFFTAEDILAINERMEALETFHTTYFNSLKMYIKSLQTIEEIRAVVYGMDIPAEYQSIVLVTLFQQIGGSGEAYENEERIE